MPTFASYANDRCQIAVSFICHFAFLFFWYRSARKSKLLFLVVVSLWEKKRSFYSHLQFSFILAHSVEFFIFYFFPGSGLFCLVFLLFLPKIDVWAVKRSDGGGFANQDWICSEFTSTIKLIYFPLILLIGCLFFFSIPNNRHKTYLKVPVKLWESKNGLVKLIRLRAIIRQWKCAKKVEIRQSDEGGKILLSAWRNTPLSPTQLLNMMAPMTCASLTPIFLFSFSSN